MDPIVQFLGRLHPLILHAPIGLAIGLAAVEVRALVWVPRGDSAAGVQAPMLPLRLVRRVLAWLLAISAIASVATGLILHDEGGYREPEVDLHQWLAIAVGALALAAAVSQHTGRMKLYAACLMLMCGVLVPAGHYGATLTHGRGFLAEPFRSGLSGVSPVVRTKGPSDTDPARSTPTVYVGLIQPIFDRSCASCHGTNRTKGGLALHQAEGLFAGGESGPVVIAGDAAGSELMRRLHLPITDDEHMPPKSKPQLSEEEINVIEDWITSGASLTAVASNVAVQPVESAPPIEVASVEPAKPDESALRALESAFVHARPVKSDSTLLVVSAAAVASTVDDTAADRLLRPVAQSIADLDLSRSKITDRTLSLIAQMPRLRRLNLSATSVTDTGVASLAGHAALEELVLSGTGTTPALQPTLAGLRSLKSVYVWKTGITTEAAAAMRAALPGVRVDAGDALTTPVIETEPVVALTGIAPPGPQPASSTAAPGDAPGLIPSNTMCPVSGKPIDAAFAIVYNKKVVGFCCKHCLIQFLDEPEKFAPAIK